MTAPTVDSVMREHAAHIETVVKNGTIGDSTFLGLLASYTFDLTRALGVDLTPAPTTRAQPPVGSVVMIHGEHGTAYQRLAADGMWHSTNGRTLTWRQLLAATGERAPIVLHKRATAPSL